LPSLDPGVSAGGMRHGLDSWDAVVSGRVTDEAGNPVANCPVVVVARSLELAAMHFEYAERGRKEIKAFTDAEGRYRIEFVPAQAGNNFFLFFYDVSGFDGVRYKRPAATEITDLLKSGGPLVANQVLAASPTWPRWSGRSPSTEPVGAWPHPAHAWSSGKTGASSRLRWRRGDLVVLRGRGEFLVHRRHPDENKQVPPIRGASSSS